MRHLRSLIVVFAGTVASAVALASLGKAAVHGGWFDDPVVEWLLFVVTAWYLTGLIEMLRRRPRKWPVSFARVSAFFAGLLVIAAALLSPIDRLAETLFSIHMAQHLMLMLGAAPLFAFSDGHLVLLRTLPIPKRRSLGRTVAGAPGVKQTRREAAAWLACAIFVSTLWFWHIPAAFDWALHDAVVHSFEHAMLLISAIAFWRVILTSGGRRLSPGMAALLVSLVGVQGALLSALIMFAPRRLYAPYAGNSIDDQVLAGLLMCIPASFVYLGSTIWALARMLSNGRPHVH